MSGPERGPERPFERDVGLRAYNRGTSLWDLIDRRADATPDLVLAVDEIGRSITFGEYRRRVLETAAGFADLGVEPGDVVSWILPTWIEATIVTGALDRLGAVQNPMLNIYRDREVGFIAAQLRTKWFIVTGQWRSSTTRPWCVSSATTWCVSSAVSHYPRAIRRPCRHRQQIQNASRGSCTRRAPRPTRRARCIATYRSRR